MGVSAEVVERARARVGSVVCGKWRIERVLGVGGMAAVYAATHHNQNRVAIKMLHPGVAIDHDIKARFLREGYVANSVNHPGAVRVHDNDVTDDDVPFLVMELLEGESLEDRAARVGPVLPLPDVLQIAEQLLDVLAAAHAKGIIHRDVKPDNLLLTTDGRLKVLDFGIARLREMAGQEVRGTAAGSFMGTPAFMAPEQARGRWSEVDARSDIWAVGATMFILLTGHNVHEAETVNDQLVLAATTPAPSIAKLKPDLPVSVVELVDRALAFKQDERWPNAKAMQAALKEIADEVPFSGKLSVPRVRIAVESADREADTVAASAEVINRITGGTRDEVGTTAIAVTSSRQPTAARRIPPRAIAAVVATLGLVALIAVVATLRHGSPPPATAQQAAPVEQKAALSPTAPTTAATPTAPAASAAEPDVTPAESAAPAASEKPPPARTRHTAKRRAVRTKPAATRPAPKPQATKPAPKPKPSKPSLFDSRY